MSKQTTENTAFHAMDAQEALRILKSDRESGLRTADAEARLQKYERPMKSLQRGKQSIISHVFWTEWASRM